MIGHLCDQSLLWAGYCPVTQILPHCPSNSCESFGREPFMRSLGKHRLDSRRSPVSSHWLEAGKGARPAPGGQGHQGRRAMPAPQAPSGTCGRVLIVFILWVSNGENFLLKIFKVHTENSQNVSGDSQRRSDPLE